MVKTIIGIAAAVAVLVVVRAGRDVAETSHDRLLASYEGDYVPIDSITGMIADTLISPFDEVFRQEGERSGYDWRLLAAIAYKESRFDHLATSRRGARGLMQVMPATARRFGVGEERITDPRTNIRLGIRLLQSNRRALRMPANMAPEDRLSILLASYNAGIGHVLDARRLARKYGADPNAWSDVAYYLSLKADSTYHADTLVTTGAFRGAEETLLFVDAVMARYERYKATIHVSP